MGGIQPSIENLVFMKTTADKLFGSDYVWSTLAAGRHEFNLCTVGAIMGAIGGGAFGDDPLEEKRKARGKAYATGYANWAGGDYASLTQMVGEIPGYLLSPKYLHDAYKWVKGMPDSQTMWGVQKGMQAMVVTMEKLGSSAPAIGAGVKMTTVSLKAFVRETSAAYPEIAAKQEELRQNMLKLFSQDLLKQFQAGAISLGNMRKQLQNLGIENQETMTNALQASYNRLFMDTLPLGEVQLQNLYEDIQELWQKFPERCNGLKLRHFYVDNQYVLAWCLTISDCLTLKEVYYFYLDPITGERLNLDY